MNQQNRERLGIHLREQKITAALLSNPSNITWLTGYAPPIETGSNPFEGGPALAWYHDGQVVLILSDMELPAARASGAEVVDYVAYTIDEPLAGMDNQGAALTKALSPFGTLESVVGVEFNFLPAALLEILRRALPLVTFQALDGGMEPLRAVKSAAEVEHIRAALKLCDLAQAEAKMLIQPGKTEIEVWGTLKARLELEAGGRLPVLADFVAGGRSAEIGGLPGNNIIREGDAVIVDIVPRLDGYWGDNAGTHFAGKPSAEMEKMYTVVLAALRKGIHAVKPGVKACDLDRMLRSLISDQGYEPYPHHSGHGIGTSYHEEPRIVPYNPMELIPGMVIAIEPGIYKPGVGGVRLEDVVLVTSSGCEVLTHHLGNA